MPLVVVAALAVVALTLLAPAAAQQRAGLAGDCTADSSWGSLRPDLAGRVIDLVNAHRRGLGLRPLSVSPKLTRAAVWKARHMARFRYMSHDDPAPPVGRTAAQRIAACGYGGAGWGENIAYGYPTAAAVVQAWLNSPGHRANIENASFSATGVGAASGNGVAFWAQDFGTSLDSGAVRRPNGAAAPRTASSTKPAELAVSRLVRRRGRAHAGHRFSARTEVVSVRTHHPVTSGQVKCDARVGRRYLRVVVNAFKRDMAACAWRVPRSLKGRYLSGRIRVRADGTWGVRRFWRRIH
jgi:uncharacterized protein YkwD